MMVPGQQVIGSGGLIEVVSERVEQLTRAVESRDIIGQAKGILMERYNLTGVRARDHQDASVTLR